MFFGHVSPRLQSYFKKYLPFEFSSSKVLNYLFSNKKSKFLKATYFISLQMVMAVVDAGSSSSSSSSSYEVVICLEVVKTLLVVEILLFFFLGVTRLTVVTSGSVVVRSGDVNHPLSCFLTSLLEKHTSLF